MTTEPVSLRMDADVLTQVDAEAKRADITRTQVIERAIEYWFARNPLGGGTLAPGLSPQFQDELAGLAKAGGGSITLLVLDPTGRQAWTFNGTVLGIDAKAALDSGFLTIRVHDEGSEAQAFEVSVPRGSIVGWSSGRGQAALQKRLARFWRAIDGNEYIATGDAAFRRRR